MRKDKDKCKNKHETTIGKIIYGFLLFLPLFAIGVTCGYAMFNKNAYQSYGEKETTTTTILNSSNVGELYVDGQIVTIKWNNSVYSSRSQKFGFSNISLDLNNLLNTQNVHFISFEFYTSSQNFMLFFDDNETQYSLENYKNIIPDGFSYTVDLTRYNRKYIYNYVLPSITTYIKATIDNVFYYSIDKVQESPLFNWAQNSVIYTGMNNFTTALSITTPFIPLLMTYWLIISIVYFLYDIVLIILVVLHKKIHALEESI